MPPATILVVDGDAAARSLIRERLERDGHAVVEASTLAAARERLLESPPTAVLLRNHLPDGDGLAFLKDISAVNLRTHVLWISGFATERGELEWIRIGSFHAPQSPLDLDGAAAEIRRMLERPYGRRESDFFREAERRQFGIDQIVGRSPQRVEISRLVDRVIQTNASTILIEGESGTGKDLLARAIHYQSARKDAPFMHITCTALPETLLESEIFGHEKGAFTDAKTDKKGLVELAHGGTVFLNEIGEMPSVLQAKLLRFLEEKTFKRLGAVRDVQVDVRVIAATKRNLLDLVHRGKFREDLYYRLNVFPIRLSPLRERREDIPLLVDHFIRALNAEFKRDVRGVEAQALERLVEYPWPGNIRELKNVIERAMILGTDSILKPGDFPVEVLHPVPRAAAATAVHLPPEGCILDKVENELILQSLSRCRGNQTHAARLLGITRDRLRYRMKKILAGPAAPGREALAGTSPSPSLERRGEGATPAKNNFP